MRIKQVLSIVTICSLLVSCSDDDEKDGGKKDKIQAAPCKLSPLRASSIYGQDDRRDWYQVSDMALLAWAHSTVALISASDLTKRGNAYSVRAPSYASAKSLCSNQPYLDQPTPGFCSGFFVGDDLIVTAGHCVTSPAECKSTAFVFDYAIERENELPSEVPSENVFYCKKLVAQKTGADDFAVIKVDRPILNRIPFQIRRRGSASIGQHLTMIGHPVGLPSKIADNGSVTGVGNRITGSLDAFGGNSGSVVIDRSSGVVEGILVSGNADFDQNGSCYVEHRCGSDCDGEGIYPIAKIASLIPPVSGKTSENFSAVGCSSSQ